MRAGCSFSFLEVIVGCEVADSKVTSEDMDDDIVVASNRKKKIYLHLKRFFRGTRFTSIPFLRSIEGKHKVGDFVCVSGKVRLLVFIIFGCCLWPMWFDCIGLYCYCTFLLLK